MVSLEKGVIGLPQLVFLMMGFIFGSSIVLVPGGQANHDAWIAVMLGMFEGILFALIYLILSLRFKGKNLVQINEIVYGRYLGKLISLSFLLYVFHLGSLVVGNFKDFFKITTLPQTPEAILAIVIILICAYAVKNGIEVIARCAPILVLGAIVSFLASSLFLIKDFELTNLFPILEVPLKNLLVATHGAASFPFAETVVFMMIIPYIKNKQKVIYPAITALLLGGVFLTLVSIRNIGVLGPLNGIYIYPTFQADSLINVGNLLTRLEILTVIGFLTMGFIKISVLLYASVLGGAQVLGLRTYQPLVLPVGILMALISLINFKNVAENAVLAQQSYPIYAMPFVVGIPLLTLIVALIRGLPKPEQ